MKRIFFLLFITLWSKLALCEERPWYSGFWETEGYGYIFSIQNDTAIIFEKTSESCLKSGLSSGRLMGAESNSVRYFNVSIPGFIDAKMELYKHSDTNQITFHRNDTNTKMLAKRLRKVPEACFIPPNPKEALKVFIQNFREHYPFLSRYPELTYMSSSESRLLNSKPLFNEMTNILKVLNDPHTALVAPDIEQLFFGNELPNRNAPSSQALKKISQRVFDNYLVGPYTVLNDQMRIGELEAGLIYLAIDGFSGLSKQGTAAAEKLALNTAAVQILDVLKGSTGLIIDVRAHSGGSDKLGVLLASNFTAQDYIAYRKQFVVNGGLKPTWKEGAPIKVSSVGSKAWLGKIVLLTSSATVSAGEAFVMALNQRTPKVIKVGNKTRGSFSDMLPRTLPNGWLFALPNERYLDSDGESYDFVGIPPDKVINEVLTGFTNNNQDSAMEEAIRLLLR
ncbi:hypothetical protein CJF42_25935 [Pseudoalteromonas sp. NBT06-2]|uniref:S41 family peptidase n=1 Tax=Pseudoalteromonas sp. NBT06-2 TaxID=2025950 RepID=UPI000BA525AD|nr:S41 family peptidase [Pseudoalteromonas sp. NBT06-2]PAJ71129.1 hypothetical protein CJF42_25935 [Pseudoalteromonas sp. NBT06-2]